MVRIFQELRSDNRHLPNDGVELAPVIVNWGKGRLRKFQTKESFHAEFCLLNKLTLKQSLLFWHANLKQTHVPQNGSDEEINKLVNVLHEDVGVVRSVFAIDRYTKVFFGRHWSLLKESQPNKYTTIRYCPICIKVNYHSYFHDYHLFKSCLIHGIELEETHYRWSSSITKYQSYTQQLGKLFETTNRYTDDYVCFSQTEEFVNACNKFEEFVNWIENTANKASSMVDMAPSFNFRNYETHQMLFTKLLVLEDSRSVFDLFEKNFDVQKIENPLVIRFDSKIIQELKKIKSVVRYEEFIQFFLLFCQNDSERHAFEVAAQQTMAKIKNVHTHCTCLVGWTRSTGWLKFEKRVNGYKHYLCPFLYTCALIENNWLSKFDKMNENFIWNPYLQTSIHYWNVINQLLGANLISVEDTDSYRFPKITFNWSFQLTFFLEVIVYSAMDNFVDSVLSWLAGYEQLDTLNTEVRFLSSNAYLKTLKDTDEVELYVWKAKGNKSHFTSLVSDLQV